MISESPEYRLLRLIRSAPGVTIQNALLRAPVREIAMSLISLSRDEQLEVLKKVPGTKRRAAEDELLYQSRLRSTTAQRREMIENLIRRLLGDNPEGISSYVRPSGR